MAYEIKNAADRRCVIISAAPRFFCEKLEKDDYIIACDGGVDHACKADIVPDLSVGDFDSFTGEIPAASEVMKVSAEKDDTDTMLAVKYALAHGFKRILLLGATGGRFDHMMANIAAAAYIAEAGGHCEIRDDSTIISVIKDGMSKIKRKRGWSLSVLSYSDVSIGVNESGVKYPLHNATLRNVFPLGVSNQIIDDAAVIEVKQGTLLLIESRL